MGTGPTTKAIFEDLKQDSTSHSKYSWVNNDKSIKPKGKPTLRVIQFENQPYNRINLHRPYSRSNSCLVEKILTKDELIIKKEEV